MQSIEQDVRQFIQENFLFGHDDVMLHDDDSLMERGIVDSTGVLELVMFLEETYHVQVDDHDLIPANLDSIQNIVRFVQRKRAAEPVMQGGPTC